VARSTFICWRMAPSCPWPCPTWRPSRGSRRNFWKRSRHRCGWRRCHVLGTTVKLPTRAFRTCTLRASANIHPRHTVAVRACASCNVTIVFVAFMFTFTVSCLWCDALQVRADLPWTHHVLGRVLHYLRSAGAPAVAA
jgi:hypothetical protein